MKRKLVKQGEVTLMVSLPSQWIKQNSLKQGDEVDIAIVDNKAIVSGIGELPLRSITFSITHDTQQNMRILIASAYKAGYEEIILDLKTTVSLEKINEIIASFTGLEVVSQTDEKYILKSFLADKSVEIEQMIIKMFQIASHISHTLLKDWNKVNLQNMHTLVKVNNMKLRDHCLRMIHLNIYEGDKSYDYYDFVTTLELITTEYLYLAQAISKEKIKKEKYHEDALLFIDQLQSVYLKKTPGECHKLRERIGLFSSREIFEKRPASMHMYHLCRLYRHLCSRMLAICSTNSSPGNI
ncbi:MAG: AbrB/MazE/SpoVT family DNA-binding domain-containing protein [Candidatus Woesearchaeota archaeon]|jgi:hypothetical protein